jgi:hypothetical protein
VVVLGLLVVQWWFLGLLVRMEALEDDRSVSGSASASPIGASIWRAAGGLAVDTSAPAFVLENLQGETLTLDSLRQTPPYRWPKRLASRPRGEAARPRRQYRGVRALEGKKTLLLFGNPGRGFCQQMLPDFKEWEANRPVGAPKLLFVSAGTGEINREMGLASKVVLDQRFAVGRAFGASGMPSAVLLDAEGKVASGVAASAPAVLELAGADRTTT